jgi:hypothetical protein
MEAPGDAFAMDCDILLNPTIYMMVLAMAIILMMLTTLAK